MSIYERLRGKGEPRSGSESHQTPAAGGRRAGTPAPTLATEPAGGQPAPARPGAVEQALRHLQRGQESRPSPRRGEAGAAAGPAKQAGPARQAGPAKPNGPGSLAGEPSGAVPGPPGRPNPQPVEPLRRVNPALRARAQERLAQELEAGSVARVLTEEEQRRVREIIMAVLEEEGSIPPLEREYVGRLLYDDLLGYGPIQPLLDDPSISEVMVNGANHVYVERRGRLERVPVAFTDDQHVLQIIERIVTPLGRRIDESSPMVDARLPDGSRVNAVIPPLALKGPSLTIRKFARQPITIEQLVEWGSLTTGMAQFLDACVRARLNVVVSGGTGSGKTTMLNILSGFIPADERIVTIEDAAELQLRQEHVVALETRPANVEGRGEVSIRQLVRNALRMRPDRIVVGEVRGGEALDMLQAMNTGHDGSLTTGHANSPLDMISRLETMVLMAGMELPLRAIREQIAAAVDLIVQAARLRDGTRRITHITEVQGIEGEVVVLQDIFRFEAQGIDDEGRVVGRHRPTGIRPKFYERLEAAGVAPPFELFLDGEEGET